MAASIVRLPKGPTMWPCRAAQSSNGGCAGELTSSGQLVVGTTDDTVCNGSPQLGRARPPLDHHTSNRLDMYFIVAMLIHIFNE